MSMKFKRFLSLTLALLMIVGMMPTNFGVTADAASETKTVYVGVIEYVINESKVVPDKIHWWNDSTNGNVAVTKADGTMSAAVGSSYWGNAKQMFHLYTAEVPTEATGLKLWNGNSSTWADIDLTNAEDQVLLWFEYGGSYHNVAHSHSYGEVKEVTPSTCVAQGSGKQTCGCGMEKTVALKLADHNFGTDGKCTTDGCTAECDHVWGEETPGICTVCGYQCHHENWEEGMCQGCTVVCAHAAYENGVCKVCGKAEPTAPELPTMVEGLFTFDCGDDGHKHPVNVEAGLTFETPVWNGTNWQCSVTVDLTQYVEEDHVLPEGADTNLVTYIIYDERGWVPGANPISNVIVNHVQTPVEPDELTYELKLILPTTNGVVAEAAMSDADGDGVYEGTLRYEENSDGAFLLEAWYDGVPVYTQNIEDENAKGAFTLKVTRDASAWSYEVIPDTPAAPPAFSVDNNTGVLVNLFCRDENSHAARFEYNSIYKEYATVGKTGYDENEGYWTELTVDRAAWAAYVVEDGASPLYAHVIDEMEPVTVTYWWNGEKWKYKDAAQDITFAHPVPSDMNMVIRFACDEDPDHIKDVPLNTNYMTLSNTTLFEGEGYKAWRCDITVDLAAAFAGMYSDGEHELVNAAETFTVTAECEVGTEDWNTVDDVDDITVYVSHIEKTCVAEVNGDSYETLADAFDAAESGDTITLIADVTVDKMITVKNKSVTLDLNGKTVTAGQLSATSDMVLWVQNNAALTVNNSAENGTIVNGHVYGYAILNQGTLTVNGGTFIGDTALWNGYDNINAVATINGGVFNANKASEYSLYAVGNAGTLTVNDGEITDWVDTFGTLNIKGGAVENIYIDDSRASVAQRATTVSGGEVGCLYVDENNEENAVSVSGGTFTEAPEAEYIAAGYKLVENENGTYSVELKKVDISVPEDVETPEDVEEEVVEQIVESIVNNTAITHPENINRLNATSYKDGADTLPGEDVDINSVIKIELKSIAAEDTAISAITFDVTPVLTWTEDGEEKEAEIKEFNAPITFRLPVPSVITGEYVIVKHEGDSMGKFEIKGEGNNRYVELTSDKFSLYSMEPVPAATLDNGCVTKGSDKVRITVEAHNVYATESIVLKLYSAAFGDEPIATSTGVETLLNKNYSTLTTSFMIKGTSSSWTTVWAEGHPIAWAEPDRAELYVDGVKVAESKVTTNSADTVESAKIAWSEVEGVNPAPASIGKIGYKNLQAAVDAVKNGETILLNPEVTHTEGATINNGVQFTIDGQEATVTASIVLGLNQNVTVKNINFVNTGVDEIYFIKTNSKNSNPILVVDGCTFTGKEGTTTVGVLTQHPTDVTIKNCTGTKLHSLLQNTNGHKVTVENVEVEAYEGGLNLNNVITAVIKNVKITSAGEYGIRLDAGNASNITAENVTVNAENGIPVYVRKATKDGWNLTLNGENALTAKEGYPMIALNKDKDYGVSNGEVTVTRPEAKITVTLSGTGVEGENILGVVHSVGNKYYTVMPKGTLDGGAVVNNGTTGNDGSYINFEIRDYVAFDSMQIKLFSGETLISTTVLAKSEYLNNGNISCAAEITRNSSSWDTTWETAPNAGQIPTKAELWIDGIKVSETEKIGIYDMPGHVENWADIEGVATIEVINGEESEWFNTLAEALAAAEDGATVKLHESVKVLAATGEVTGGKTVTVTGKATFDWSKGWLFVGRGSNEGNGKLIFNKAQIASASNNSSCGLNISGAKKGSATTNYGTVEMINSTVEVDYMLNANDLTLDNTKLTVKNGFRVSGRPANETPDGEMGSATMTVKNGSSVTVDNENGMGIADEGKGTLNLENSTFTALRTFTVHEDNGTFNVSGESTLNIKTLTGNSIDLLDGAIIKDSTVGGEAFVAGNVTFRGDNTFAMIYDYGTLTDYYGTTANMKWSVEPGSSLTLTKAARYGLGYGDDVTVTGELTDALSARDGEGLKASLFMHGLVAQESPSWKQTSNFNVKNAYVVIGSNNSFGNKPGNYGGTYNFKFENTVLDASRITFYEALSTTNFEFLNSDVVIGQFMTNDADSKFTLTNTKLLSTSTVNGNDENQTNAGELNLINSELTYSILFTNNGTIKMDTKSLLTAPSIAGTGTITIDAAEIAAAEIGTKATVIVLTDRPQNIDSLNIELVNGLGVELKYSNDDGSVYLERSATVAANGDVAYATVQEAIAAAAQNDGDKTVKLLCDVTEENATVIVSGGVTLDLNGFDLDVSHIAAFTGNHIVDSNTEKGLLKVAKGNIMVQSNNKQMAVYTGNGYIFTAVNVNQIMFDSSYTEGVFKVKFKPGFGNNGGASIAKTYFGDNGSKDNGIEIGLLLTWELADGTQVTQTFDYAAEMIMDAYNNNRVFTLAVTGIGSISELDIQLVVKSDVGAIASSAALEYSRN